jgi:hypothetical protein
VRLTQHGLLGLPALQIGDFSFQSERRIYLLIWLAALLVRWFTKLQLQPLRP